MNTRKWLKRIGLRKRRDFEPLSLLPVQDVLEICKGFDLQDAAKIHLTERPQPHAFVARLLHDEYYLDATRFLAYALPEREAVWWACQCVRSLPICYPDRVAAQALDAAEQWVQDPNPRLSENALAAAKQNSFEMPSAPAAWTAMGAACTTNRRADAVAPFELKHTTAQAIAGAIALAATAEIDKSTERYSQFIECGVVIAQGKGAAIPSG